ncbi:MAG: ATP-dependent helicase [Chitinophagaceae bacterium]|nr:MAG: ATP-dependent helicase [Chitinophagaceae bacterium]
MSLNRERLETKFHEEYEKLNEQQRRAVDQIEGPVMVIAGPGTGKTQILASRIGKILLDTDASPDNILCLTYTDAGALAMRKRLLQFVGPEAYKVNIHTFHAFCNEVIQDNLSLFEKNSLDAISDLEKIELFKKLIDSLPKNNPLKRYRGDVYFEVKNLASLFSNMKREGWTPEFINGKIDAYLADLPTRDGFTYKRKYKEFNAGDLNQNKFNDEKDKMEKLRAAVGEFDRFQEMMREAGRYDFDDMINWVIRAFRENPNLLVTYQERFTYILVDEYQDTSGTQNALVSLLINYWDQPNVFVVGDDDQSIYRFQGANVDNMIEFGNSYKESLMTVVLTSNYRSTQPILDVSKTLINRNSERLINKISGLSKELLSSNVKLLDLKHLPIIRQFETQRHEMIGITREVQGLLEQGIAPGRIGIIYKENKYGETLTQYFKLLKIPVYSRRHLNILDLPLARNILDILRYLAAEHDIPYGGDEMLFEILHFSFFHIPPIEIAKLSIEVADRHFSDRRTSIRRLLTEKAVEPKRDLFDPGMPDVLRNASVIIEGLVGDVPNVTLQVLFEQIIRKTGILKQVMESPNRHEDLQVLTSFFDFIKDETQRDKYLNLDKLVSLIALMEKEKINLPLVQVSGTEKGVNLMTAHGSKGLEFEYVFFVGCNAGSWEKKRKPSGGYTLPDNMFTSQSKSSDEEELRRLFYVALTRAEQHLYISFASYKQDGKQLEPSMFIAEIQDEHPLLQPQVVMIPKEEMDVFSILEFTEQAPEIAQMEEDIISRMLDKFVMNVTALNNYLNCPLEFYFKNLIRIPSPKNEATEFGSAVHHALEKLFDKMLAGTPGNKDIKKFPTREEFIGDFEWYLYKHRESFTREQFERRMEYGHTVLENYYDKYINQFNKVVVIERRISNVIVKGVPIKGKLDKLEFNGRDVTVVDYKTGDPVKAQAKLKPPSEKLPNGGDYWRQAVFYKILVDNYASREWTAVAAEFDFIEPDNKKEYQKTKVLIGPNDITTVSNQISTVWTKIQDRDFYTGCGKEDCHWCNFVKENNLAVALHEIEGEPEEE